MITYVSKLYSEWCVHIRNFHSFLKLMWSGESGKDRYGAVMINFERFEEIIIPDVHGLMKINVTII